MTYSSPTSYSRTQAADSSSGCLRRFLLPPLAVVLVSALLAFGLTRIDTAQASAPEISAQENAKAAKKGLAPLFTPEVMAWEDKILAWSTVYQLDPNLVATVMQIESCGYVDAESGSGAMGLFQVMPYHFQEGEDPFLPEVNAFRGLKYLRQAQESAGGSTRLTLAGYNGGINAARAAERYWAYETQRYVYWGLGIYRDARSGLDYSPRLEEWLAAGGSGLCKLARQSQQ